MRSVLGSVANHQSNVKLAKLHGETLPCDLLPCHMVGFPGLIVSLSSIVSQALLLFTPPHSLAPIDVVFMISFYDLSPSLSP